MTLANGVVEPVRTTKEARATSRLRSSWETSVSGTAGSRERTSGGVVSAMVPPSTTTSPRKGGQGIGKGGDAEGKREVDDGNIVGDGKAAISDDKGIGVAKACDGAGECGIEQAGFTHR